MNQLKTYIENPWDSLKRYTQARVAIGRCGSSIPTKELLDFKLCHAKAIDAVHIELNTQKIANDIDDLFNEKTILLHSAAKDRGEYLRRPDLGRKLSKESVERLKSFTLGGNQKPDVALVIADGLSSFAIEKNVVPFLQNFLPLLKKHELSIAPITVVEQGRVAVADEVGKLFKARLIVILIGERPGLKTPDSLGIYMTYKPTVGTTDERRNCISNVRPEGLSYEIAAHKLMYLINEAFARQLSGVELKDEQDTEALLADSLQIVEK